MTNEILIQCENLLAGYSEAVNSPGSFTVRAGEVFGIRGQNGVGKSTLLKALAGSAKIFSGSYFRKAGTELLHHRQFWESNTESPLTGRDICRLTGADRRTAPARIEALLDKRLDQLSGGQGQLLRLWACLGSSADILLLDEPTNSLDEAAITALIEMVQQQRDDRAILVVSHEPYFLDAICSHSIELE